MIATRARIVIVLAGAVLCGGALTSTSAVAEPGQAQTPIDHPICNVSTPAACQQLCEGRRTPIQDGGRACDELGRMYRDGTPGVVGGVGAANLPEAIKWFRNSCDNRGWSAGCSDLAGAYLKSGDTSVEPDARAAYERGCRWAAPNLGHEACYGLAEMCEAGRGGPKDVPAARAAYEKACSGGDTRGCTAAKRLDPSSQKAPAPHPPGSPTSAPLPPKVAPAPAPTAGRAAPVR